MSTELPSWIADEGLNPYAPPKTAIDEEPVELFPTGDLAEAEAIRRANIGHEAAVKSIGSLHLLGAFLFLLGVAGMVIAFLTGADLGPMDQRMALIVGVVFYVLLGGLHLALGIGLTRLQTWARWTDVGLLALSLPLIALGMIAGTVMRVPAIVIGYGLGAMIPGYMLYLLVSPKAMTVFSPEYRAIIARTPHIKRRTSLVVKIVLAILIALIALGIGAAIFGR